MTFCDYCHWRNKKEGYIGCSNIGVPGWDIWAETSQPPKECNDFILPEDYEPDPNWKFLIQKVREVVDAEDE